MKKIVLGLLIALMAFAFMGCPTVYDDIDYDENSELLYHLAGQALEAISENIENKNKHFEYADSYTLYGGVKFNYIL